MTTYIRSSESVGEGHPDKLCDKISDAILDACLAEDHNSRVACETAAKGHHIFLLGEITTKAKPNYNKIIRDTVKEIGYIDEAYGLNHLTLFVHNYLGTQSPDISQGVTEGQGLEKEQGAGDQGLMWGYATNETENYMPMPLDFAHKLVYELKRLREKGIISWLRPDCKSQVAMRYVDGKPTEITNIVIAQQHADIEYKEIYEEILNKAIVPVCSSYLTSNTRFHINGTGKFVIGGPKGDAGVTGRKIIVDTYGGFSGHGGGAFSGKDPSKVDRSAAYAARWVAKNLVAAGFADKVNVQLAYCIGVAEPTSICVNDDDSYTKLINDIFPLKPKEIIEHFGLKNPQGWSYKDTAAYGHFGRDIFPWEKLDMVNDILKKF